MKAFPRQSLIAYHRWYLAGRLSDYLRELVSVKELPVHSMPKSKSTSVSADGNCPIRSEDRSDEGTNAGVSVAAPNASLSCSTSYEPNPEPHPQACSTVIAGSSPACRPADPAATSPSRCDVSPSDSDVVSSDAALGTGWWNEGTFTRAFQQALPAIDTVHPNLGLSPSTSSSFNSLDTILGIPIDGHAFTRGATPEQTHISDDEMAAWLKAPTSWQLVLLCPIPLHSCADHASGQRTGTLGCWIWWRLVNLPIYSSFCLFTPLPSHT
jgi:hypothetical protein